MPGRKEVRGGAAALSLASSITDVSSSCQVNGSVSGWPTGASYPFVICIDRDGGSEEKILCSDLTGSNPATITFATRGYDGTAAANHSSAATVEHCLDADTIDDLFDHVYDTSRADHDQYIHSDGDTAFTGLDAIADVAVDIGTSNTAGSGTKLARSNHVHQIGAGAIDNANMFAAGVVDAAALAENSVGNSELADNAVAKANMQDDSVGSAELEDDAVDSQHIADGAIDSLAMFGSVYRPVSFGTDNSTFATLLAAASEGDILYDGENNRLWVKTATGSRLIAQPGFTVVTCSMSGDTSGSTEMQVATTTLAASPVPYKLDVAAFLTAYNVGDDDDSYFDFRIKVAGSEVEEITERHTGGGNIRRHYSIPCIETAQIAANTAVTVSAHLQRNNGNAALREETPGTLRCVQYWQELTA